MKKARTTELPASKEAGQRALYEPPAIIYEGLITTRAGSDVATGSKNSPADPAGAFSPGG